MIKFLLTMVASLLMAIHTVAQVQISPLVMPRKQFLDAAGRPLAGGHVCTYLVGTTTPQVTYTDYTGGVPNGVCNPLTDPPHSDGIILDAGGYASIYINCTENPYKIVVYDKDLVLQWSEDGVQYPSCVQISQSCPAGQAVTGIDADGNVTCGTFCPTCGDALICDPTKLVTVYIDPAGNDTTGDGTIGNPWLTIQKAWDSGIPGFVDGTYVIQLKSPGTYPPPASTHTQLGGKSFFGYGFDESDCSTAVPCSLVKIRGDIANSEAYIIGNAVLGGDEGAINVNGVPVTFEGLAIANSKFGLAVQNGGIVSLGAVSFIDDQVGLELQPGSMAYLIGDQYVNDCIDAFPDCDVIRFYNTYSPGPDGMLFSDYAIQLSNANLSDLCGSFLYDLGQRIAIYDAGLGGVLFGTGIFAQGGSVITLSGTTYIDGATYGGAGTGISNQGSLFSLNNLTVDGSYTGIVSFGGFVSGAMFGVNNTYDVKNATVGVNLGGAGEIVDIPNLTTVTTDVTASKPREYFDANTQKVPVLYSQLAGLAQDGAVYKCIDCDTPASPGAACSNAGPASEALAYYVRAGWICF